MPINPDYPNYPNVDVVSAPNSGLFTNYIFKAIPLAFDDSMSYYETLCGLLDYLKNTIIPTVNNNADAVSELQQLYDQLHDYVKNYFDNVNVQAEINNKLDAMVADGSLQSIISSYIDPAISQQNQFLHHSIDQQNNTLASFQEQINSIQNVGPIPVSSVDDMTDTTKIYINTTDGYWYWFDDPNWTQGGVFQQAGISEGQISFLMFSNDIASNFNFSLSDNITPPEVNSVYYYVSDGVITTTSVPNLGYSSYILSLQQGMSYLVSAVNRWLTPGFIIANANDDVLYDSYTEDDSDFVGVSKLFIANQAGLKLYVNRVNYTDPDYSYHYYMTQVRSINDTFNNFKIKNTPPLLFSINDSFPNVISKNIGDTISFTSVTSDQSTSSTSYIYQISKGLSYTINSSNLYLISGITLTDLSYHLTYKSSSEYSASNTPVSYSFTADNDGYAVLTSYSDPFSSPVSYSISLNYSIDLPSNSLSGKSVLWAGDSIANGAGNNNVSYADMISNHFAMPFTKYTRDGRCVTKEVGQTSVLDVLPSMSNSADFVIFEGGWNDMYRVPLGSLSSGFNAQLNEYTWIGALESLVKQSLAKWPNSRIGFILPHGITDSSMISTQNQFWDAAISVFNKWHFPYIDLRHNGLCAYNNDLLDAYFLISQSTGHGDDTHPNNLGYVLFYNNQIASWMNSF